MSEETIQITQQVKEDLFDACRSLGKVIVGSEENKRFIDARERFRQDEEAKSILRDYNTTLSEYQKKVQWGGASDEEYKKVEEKNNAMFKVVYKINPHSPEPTVSSILGLLNFWLDDK